MEAHPRTLKFVFRSDVRLTVPLFQRPYVWTADEQWLPLWEDILATRDRMNNGDTTPHFLGAVVLEQKRGSLGSLETREVIDGQQRLTTLQLATAALRDAFMSHGIGDKHYRRINKLLVNDSDLVDEPDELHKLWPTNRDRNDYRAVMVGHYRTSDTTGVGSRIVNCYIWFRDVIADLTEDMDEERSGRVLVELSEVLLEYIEIVVIDLSESDNAQVIFETLNARGTALRASDLIKNLLFRTLESQNFPVDELYQQYWLPLESDAWQADVRQGRLSRPRLDAFMGYFLTVLLQREVLAHQLFPATRQFVGRHGHSALEFLREAHRYAAVYEQIEAAHSLDPAERASLERIRVADTQTLTPVLMWLFANAPAHERLVATLAIESYVVRRLLCRLTTKNYNRLFLELLKRLGEGHGPADRVVVDFLSGQTSESGMWPTDDEIARSLGSLPIYRLVRRERLQGVLRALEAHATTGKTEGIPAGRKLSVEHLMPQSWEANWPIAAGRDPEIARDERNALLHTLGNLTLVTGSLNASMSNSAWTTKREHLMMHSALTLNRGLPLVWDEDAIRGRGQYLSDLACDLWRRPTPAEGGSIFVAESDRDLTPDRDEGVKARSQSTNRRDIGRHIVSAFANLSSGQFLTIAEIRRHRSDEYGDAPPSAGAIAARLFPPNGRTTVPGAVATTVGGIRGARKG